MELAILSYEIIFGWYVGSGGGRWEKEWFEDRDFFSNPLSQGGLVVEKSLNKENLGEITF